MPGKRASEEERFQQILKAALRVATRDRLDQLTIRSVAKEAGVSAGLVLFHFTSKEVLLRELLHWLLGITVVVRTPPELLALPHPSQRLLMVLRQALHDVAQQRARLELFFDYWVLGSRDGEMRAMIRQALDQYRSVFQELAAEVIAHEPARFGGLSPEGLALLTTSVIQGYTIQAIKEPEHLDPEGMIAALYALLGVPRTAHDDVLEMATASV